MSSGAIRGGIEAASAYSGGLISRFGQHVKQVARDALADGKLTTAAQAEQGGIRRSGARAIQSVAKYANNGGDLRAAAVGGGALALGLSAATIPFAAAHHAENKRMDKIADRMAARADRHGSDDKKVIINT